jgi:hypothetical protein
MWEYAQGTTSGMLNATIFAALIPTQAFRASRCVPARTSEELFTFPDVFLLQPVKRHRECVGGRMAGADDQDRGRRGDVIPAGIPNLGVIIGGAAVRPPANDNSAKPEPIGSPSDCDDGSTE